MMVLACDNIEATKATQIRKKLDKSIVDDYCKDIQDGAHMPPVVVFAEKGSERYILADGFHRLLAHINAGESTIEASVHEGSLHDALKFALGANYRHGLRLTNADKVNAVEMALKDPEISQLTQQEIADLCHVERHTVGRVSRKLRISEVEETEVDPGEPEENTPENNRPTKPPPTQADVERAEIRRSIELIKALPYSGDESVKLELDDDDVAGLEYVSEWCAHAVLAYRN